MTALLLFLLPALATEPDYAAECDGGNASSCVLLSILAKKSKEPAEQARAQEWLDKGVALLDKSCNARLYKSCVELGEVQQVHGDAASARSAFERACDIDPQTCVDLADKLANRPRGQKDLPVVLLERACAHEEGLGCIGAAILGEELGRGENDVQAWGKKGHDLLTARCEHGKDAARRAQACSALGDLNYFGIHTDQDRTKGLDFWAKGCVDGAACRTQAALILAQGDAEGSVALLRRACELGDCAHWYEACSTIETTHCTPIPGKEPPPPPAASPPQ